MDRVLSLDPTTHASLMVDFRWKYCGMSQGTTSTGAKSLDSDQRAALRQAAEARLEKIRSHFWRASTGKLNKSLSSIQVAEFADLKAGVERLKRLVTHRDAIETLGKHPARETNLYNTFRRMVMLSPRKAGQVKERYLREFAYSDNRKKVLAMIKMMRAQFPELIKIEADWFNQITRIKNRAKSSATSFDSGGESDFAIPGWLIGLGLLVLIRVLLIVLRNS